MTKAGKIWLTILGIIVVLAAVFCGLYFGVPAVHDWFVNLFTPDKQEVADQGVKAVKIMFNL